VQQLTKAGIIKTGRRGKVRSIISKIIRTTQPRSRRIKAIQEEKEKVIQDKLNVLLITQEVKIDSLLMLNLA